ncbi:esterase-like activity of phytase family protein [Klebsiella pneumoniae]|uniref:esterase-like activity of phytase family protein n=7 Tax=Klebsiella pneumoniae TaxID=573 RepID=UPI0013B3AEE0|nr:esterase-like activity of phytase family protein [Klebsiella pneumoniae]MCI8028337.1 esterase-like activity of phytase family protein [Klebsiella pneumoniae]MDQ5329143.1 esterase-like activity of phytase family protein [Klebsiella pneumoniae]HBR4425461.1 esterase-like activity of phytase family protein [Klebsiella pneumoniae]HBR4437540.1 esterase-like activity of phytase family protein [Klebsiella pneumoniae]HBS5858804.1 esterase-like activity of phytase family protein [Klebsiella pneumonia
MPLFHTRQEIAGISGLLSAMQLLPDSLAALADIDFASLERLYLVGSGDSYAIALMVEEYLNRCGTIQCRAVQSLAFLGIPVERFSATSLVVVISASGRPSPVLDALAHALTTKASVVGMTNSPGSPFANLSSRMLFTLASKKGMPTQSSSATLFLLMRLVERILQAKTAVPEMKGVDIPCLSQDWENAQWQAWLAEYAEAFSSRRVVFLGNGKFVEDLSAIFPEGYSVDSKKEDPEGFRSGISWEGLSFTPDNHYLYVAAEGALKQDGPLASPVNSSPARILKFRYNGGDKKPQLEKSFLYNVDPVSHISKFAINDNGVSEVLALNENKLLVVERSGRNASEGFNDWDFTVKVWLADTAASTNIKEIKSLAQVEKRSIIQPVVKKLLIDFSDVTNAPDCIEGVTFGPMIDGKKTLIFVSDNNFQPYQNTKFYLFQDVNDVLK